MKKTWYQAEGSKLAELWTILHLPYTLMNLSFLSIGFGIAGVNRWDIFAWTVLAYFFGLGIAAHAFDQLPGMGSSYVKHLTNYELMVIGMWGVMVAVTIGIVLMLTLEAWHLLWIIPLQTFFVWAYPNSKFARGFFHNDLWFAVAFGYIPVMVGYYINTLTLNPEFVLWALLAFMIAGIEITLSRYARWIRKPYPEGPYKNLLHIDMMLRPEKALKLLCVMSYTLAIAVLLT